MATENSLIEPVINKLIAKTEQTIAKLSQTQNALPNLANQYKTALKKLNATLAELKEISEPAQLENFSNKMTARLSQYNDGNSSVGIMAKSCLQSIKQETDKLSKKINSRIDKANRYLNGPLKSTLNSFLGKENQLPDRIASPTNAKENFINLVHDFKEGNLSTRAFYAKLNNIEKLSAA